MAWPVVATEYRQMPFAARQACACTGHVSPARAVWAGATFAAHRQAIGGPAAKLPGDHGPCRPGPGCAGGESPVARHVHRHVIPGPEVSLCCE